MDQPGAVENVLILGGGAMGCLFAARLAAAGATVTLVDVDEARLASIRSSGLTLRSNGTQSHVRPGAVTASEAAGPVDLVMLFTKSMHSAAAVRSIAHLAACRPAAITLQNGLGNAEALAAVFGPDSVLVGTAHVPAEFDPGRVPSDGVARR